MCSFRNGRLEPDKPKPSHGGDEVRDFPRLCQKDGGQSPVATWHLVRRDARPENLADDGIAVCRAAERDLTYLLTALLEAKNDDTANKAMATPRSRMKVSLKSP